MRSKRPTSPSWLKSFQLIRPQCQGLQDGNNLKALVRFACKGLQDIRGGLADLFRTGTLLSERAAFKTCRGYSGGIR